MATFCEKAPTEQSKNTRRKICFIILLFIYFHCLLKEDRQGLFYITSINGNATSRKKSKTFLMRMEWIDANSWPRQNTSPKWRTCTKKPFRRSGKSRIDKTALYVKVNRIRIALFRIKYFITHSHNINKFCVIFNSIFPLLKNQKYLNDLSKTA